jgi:hypothetical protein
MTKDVHRQMNLVTPKVPRTKRRHNTRAGVPVERLQLGDLRAVWDSTSVNPCCPMSITRSSTQRAGAASCSRVYEVHCSRSGVRNAIRLQPPPHASRLRVRAQCPRAPFSRHTTRPRVVTTPPATGAPALRCHVEDLLRERFHEHGAVVRRQCAWVESRGVSQLAVCTQSDTQRCVRS